MIAGGWLYWNRVAKDDMAAHVPADSLAFIEAGDLTAITQGIEESQAWKQMGPPLNAPASLFERRWLIGLARWTGLGPIDAVLVARSQVALVFTQAQATQSDDTLTIKPLAALVIQTHTSQRRMRPALEGHIEAFARKAYGQPSLTRKQVDGVDLAQWSSADNTRHLVYAFVETLAIVGNDESVVMSCVDVRRGKRPGLSGNLQLAQVRQQLNASTSPLFGFIPKAGVKPIIQAWALSRAGSTSDAATVVRLVSSTFGNLIDAFGWTARFDQNGVEDRCFVALTEGVAEKLKTSAFPEPVNLNEFSYVPPDIASVTSYRLRNPDVFWRDLNTIVSSHADVLGAIAARPFLRALLAPYGIEDADAFFSSVGPPIQIVRMTNSTPSVLIANSFDRPGLRKVAQMGLGAKPKAETMGDTELLLSTIDNWSAAFDGNSFLTGPADSVRRCVSARANSQSVNSLDSFRRAHAFVNVSAPIMAITFTNDGQAAISFVELFSRHERSAFAANAPAINLASQNLPYAVSVTMMKGDGIEWTSKSSFGLLGSLFTSFAPEKSP